MYISVHEMYLLLFLMKIEFCVNIFWKILEYQIFVKICPVRTEFFHASGQTETHYESNRRFS